MDTLLTTGTILLSQATLADVPTLLTLGSQTFLESFAASNTPENMQQYMEKYFTLEKLTAEVRHPESEFYLATLENTAIGYLKLNFGSAQTEHQDTRAVEIERIYVQQAFHGKLVGQMLYDKALERARQVQAPYLWLGVWEHNPKALRFYEKNGFVAFGTHIFRLGSDEQTDILMKQELSYT